MLSALGIVKYDIDWLELFRELLCREVNSRRLLLLLLLLEGILAFAGIKLFG